MIRPRGGGFVYTDAEIDAMTRDIELAEKRGIAGIVTGALTADGRVHIAHTRTLVNAAGGLPVTFHRALDCAGNLTGALEQLIDIDVSRILTSGAAATALDGAATIAALVDQARERIAIIAGGGIRTHNVREVISRTRVRAVHSRLVDEMTMRGLVDLVRANASISP
jgi:copper homeostasis protein